MVEALAQETIRHRVNICMSMTARSYLIKLHNNLIQKLRVQQFYTHDSLKPSPIHPAVWPTEVEQKYKM